MTLPESFPSEQLPCVHCGHNLTIDWTPTEMLSAMRAHYTFATLPGSCVSTRMPPHDLADARVGRVDDGMCPNGEVAIYGSPAGSLATYVERGRSGATAIRRSSAESSQFTRQRSQVSMTTLPGPP